jgi:hypothetical protein
MKVPVKPSVNALPGLFCCYIYLPVDFRGYSHHKFTGKRFVWSFPSLFAKIKIVVNGAVESFFNLFDGPPLKCHYIPDPNHLTVKDHSFIVKLYCCGISFIVHHG